MFALIAPALVAFAALNPFDSEDGDEAFDA